LFYNTVLLCMRPDVLFYNIVLLYVSPDVLFYNTVLLCMRPDVLFYNIVLLYVSPDVLFYNIVLLCVRSDGTSRKQTASHAAREHAEGGRRCVEYKQCKTLRVRIYKYIFALPTYPLLRKSVHLHGSSLVYRNWFNPFIFIR
jgi:hypothetical protein